MTVVCRSLPRGSKNNNGTSDSPSEKKRWPPVKVDNHDASMLRQSSYVLNYLRTIRRRACFLNALLELGVKTFMAFLMASTM